MKETRYSYDSSIKSRVSDELFNTYVIRPTAGLIVRLLYHTNITPNQVTLLSAIIGFIAAFFLTMHRTSYALLAGILIELKDIFDSADGQLARIKNLLSRRGRFFDSIADIAVNAGLFFALGYNLFSQLGNHLYIILAFVAFAGTTLRVSYHVFYQVSFLHTEKLYTFNRVLETVMEEDKRSDPLTFRLQRLYLIIYGWQDKMMAALDSWCLNSNIILSPETQRRWYRNEAAIRLNGLLGLGTELAILAFCTVVQRLDVYLWINILILNSVWMIVILYRKFFLSSKIEQV